MKEFDQIVFQKGLFASVISTFEGTWTIQKDKFHLYYKKKKFSKRALLTKRPILGRFIFLK